jgi:phage tail-like protein
VRLRNLRAVASPAGHRIDLTWTLPDKTVAVRVVRRENTHPADPDDGVLVADEPGLVAASDTGLRAETVYYYTLFPNVGDPPVFDPDPRNRVSAMATAQYGFAERLYQLLPSIYRRYDAAELSGPLRRFLDLPGSQLDQIYSLIRATLALHDLNRVDGELLPLLAQWIGWRTDHGRSIAAQRNEIQYAPDIYRTVGAIGSVQARVARMTDWTARTKEYVHNVARTNVAEQLNLWAMERDATGGFGPASLVSMNALYEGRAAHVRDSGGSDLFAYHTYRRHGWDIWAKSRSADGVWQPSQPLVDRPGIDKHPALAMLKDTLWLFWESYDEAGPPGERHWRVLLQIRSGDGWSPISVVGDPVGVRRNPTAVVDDADRLWLFWREWTAGVWQIRFNVHDGTAWQLDPAGTVPEDSAVPIAAEDALIAMFHPDRAGQRLWLFWAGRAPGGPVGQTRWSVAWRVKAGTDPSAADWSPVQVVPKASGADHDRDPAPLPIAAGVELFWASTRVGGWSLVRAARDEGAQAWGAAERLAEGPYTGRAPMAVTTATGTTLLTFRTNQSLSSAHALDARYAGTTTVRVLDSAKRALWGGFEDFQAYTYDSGQAGVRTHADRIARDTVGLFLEPPDRPGPAESPDLDRLTGVLPEVMPVTTRTVLIVQQP